jgi:membrane protein
MTDGDQKRRRGRPGIEATSPWGMPLAAWKAVAVRVWNQSWDDNIGLVAAGVTFYSFFALVPLLGILVLAYGLMFDPASVVQHVRSLVRILPPDASLLIGQLLLNAVRQSQETAGLGVVAALLVAIYAGGNGAGSIMTALNIAYEEKEKRSLGRFYAIAFTMTLAALMIALLALAAVTAIQSLERLVRLSGPQLLAGKAMGYGLLALFAAAVAASLYRYGPSREDARWEWITPGSVFTAVVWLGLSAAFGFYVTRLSNYSATYGSLAAIVMLLSWMYLSAYVFLFGAEINAELEHQTRQDSTTGAPRPLGERGAWAADHVAGDPSDQRAEKGPSLAEAGPPKPTEDSDRRDPKGS